jgi:hypothetical protein
MTDLWGCSIICVETAIRAIKNVQWSKQIGQYLKISFDKRTKLTFLKMSDLNRFEKTSTWMSKKMVMLTVEVCSNSLRVKLFARFWELLEFYKFRVLLLSSWTVRSVYKNQLRTWDQRISGESTFVFLVVKTYFQAENSSLADWPPKYHCKSVLLAVTSILLSKVLKFLTSFWQASKLHPEFFASFLTNCSSLLGTPSSLFDSARRFPQKNPTSSWQQGSTVWCFSVAGSHPARLGFSSFTRFLLRLMKSQTKKRPSWGAGQGIEKLKNCLMP